MPIIRNRADLVLAAVAKDNPSLGVTLGLGNCWVYKIGSFSTSKGFCTVKGKWGTGVRAKKVVRYHKLDLTKLLQDVSHLVRATGYTKISEILTQINDTFGLDLTSADIIDHTFTESGTKGLLEISPNSNFYTGSVDLFIRPAPLTLASQILVRNLAPALEYWPVQGALSGAYLSLGHDYTIVGPQLASITGATLTDAQASSLASWLSGVDGVPWTALAGQYSLKGATIVFSGKSEDTPAAYQPLLKGLFNRVLVLKPNTTYATNLAAAPMAFHYNIF